MTFFDSDFFTALPKPVDSATPSGTALKPLTFAAADSATKSLPALANSSFALGNCIQPITWLWSSRPPASSSSYCAPVHDDCTTAQG